MMHEFISANQDELARRCRIKAGSRPGRSANDAQLPSGIPLFISQLIRTLKLEHGNCHADSVRLSGTSEGGAPCDVGTAAAGHGRHLLKMGLSVDQVVHEYGDVCQSISDLAIESQVPFTVDEFRTLNRCLDNATADAVAEFSEHSEIDSMAAGTCGATLQLGKLVHDMRNLLWSATLALRASRTGRLDLNGPTGAILDRSLQAMARLLATSCATEVPPPTTPPFSLAHFIDEIYQASALVAKGHDCTLRAPQVASDLALCGERDLLMGAVSNLVHHAVTATQTGSEVLLSAYAESDRIRIDVTDHGGGLAPGVAETMFAPHAHSAVDGGGIGPGLAIALHSVQANGGDLSAHTLPGSGCVYSISMPRHRLH